MSQLTKSQKISKSVYSIFNLSKLFKMQKYFKKTNNHSELMVVEILIENTLNKKRK